MLTFMLIVAFSCFYGLLLGPLIIGPTYKPHWNWQRYRDWLQRGLLLYPLGVICAIMLQFALQRTEGIFALIGIFTGYLLVSVFLLIPIALLRGFRILRLAIGVCFVWWLLGYATLPRTTVPEVPTDAAIIRVLNWNSLAFNDQDMYLLPLIRSEPAEIIVLQETGRDRLMRDPQIMQAYPYQHVQGSKDDVVVLSKFPLEPVPEITQDFSILKDYRQIITRVKLPNDRTTILIAVHAHSPGVFPGCLGICYTTALRDQQLHYIRGLIDAALALNEPVLAVGDFNIAPTEPTYEILSADMHEAFDSAHVRSNRGVSWPIPVQDMQILRFLKPILPLIKIDHMFTSSQITTLQAEIDCSWRGSDHCVLRNMFAIP